MYCFNFVGFGRDWGVLGWNILVFLVELVFWEGGEMIVCGGWVVIFVFGDGWC